VNRALTGRGPVTVIAPLAVVAVVIFALTTEGFATSGNFKSIAFSTAFVGTIAIGQTVIMLSGNYFSLSLGTTAAVSAIVFLSAVHFGTVAAIIIALAFGAAVCGLQGLLVGAWGANPIIVTIGAGVIQSGVVLLITGGGTVRPSSETGLIQFFAEPIAGIPAAFYVFVVMTIVVELVLRFTRLGAGIHLLGGSREAARAAGLPVTWIVVGAFGIAGICAAAASIVLGSFQGSATLSLEGTLTYDSIAAALVGGSAVLGGRGSALRTFIGTIGITTLSSALLLRGYATGVQIVVKGVIVLGAVLLVHVSSRRSSR
ncbi:MAG TPA: ABC transporter permease, partial [Solirubrobacterales bacterium]|nr:ABC transporter permease [Solirubrobacterales bacterium]